MNTNEFENDNNQIEQLTDLSLTEEQAEQAKGGSEMKYNFAGIEGAASAAETGGILVTGSRIRRPN